MAAAVGVDPTFGGMLLILSLVIGLFCRNIVSKFTSFPYTAVLLVIGLLIGGLSSLMSLGQLTDSIDKWVNIDPHALLYLFLPLLIFESAFSIDFYVFRRLLPQALTLAVPGLLISSVLTAVWTRWVFPYEWDWNQGMLMGVLLSATDPVAVVALLKELSVSENLSTLIEGESLLNDGTAMVFFALFKDAIHKQESVGFGEVVGLFAQMSFGAVAVGAAFSFLCLVILTYIYNDAMSEITVTVVGCYATFVVGEATLHVSGVIAVVTFGVLMSGFGRSRITPEVEEAANSFWEMMGYMANSIIFVISGVIIMEKALLSQRIVLADWGHLFLLYLALTVIRAIATGLCSPVLMYTGTKASIPDLAVATWGGLRGAVGLALALMVNQEFNNLFGERVLFYASGIAFLTLLINGSTMRFVLGGLGYLKQKDESKAMFDKACALIQEHVKDEWSSMQSDDFLAGADFQKAWLYVPIYSQAHYNLRKEAGYVPNPGEKLPPGIRNRWKRYQAKWDKAAAGAKGACSTSFGSADLTDETQMPLWHFKRLAAATPTLPLSLLNHRLVEIVRERFLYTVNKTYWHRYEHGYLGRRALDELRSAVSRQLGDEEHELSEWTDYLHTSCTISRSVRWLYGHKMTRFLARPLIQSELDFAYDVTNAFIQAHEHVIEMSRSWGHGKETHKVILESKKQVRAAQFHLNSMTEGFPEIARVIRTKCAIRALTVSERHFHHKLYHNGAINEGEYQMLQKHNNATFKKAMAHGRSVLRLPSPRELITACPMFAKLPESVIDDLIKHSTEKSFEHGADIYPVKGDPKGMYLIERGTVNVIGVQYRAQMALPVTLGRVGEGNVFGVVDLSLAIFFSKRQVMALAASHPEFRNELFRTAALNAAGWFLRDFSEVDPVRMKAALAAGHAASSIELTSKRARPDPLILLRGRGAVPTSIVPSSSHVTTGTSSTGVSHYAFFPETTTPVSFSVDAQALVVPSAEMFKVFSTQSQARLRPTRVSFHSLLAVQRNEEVAKSVAARMLARRRASKRKLALEMEAVGESKRSLDSDTDEVVEADVVGVVDIALDPKYGEGVEETKASPEPVTAAVNPLLDTLPAVAETKGEAAVEAVATPAAAAAPASDDGADTAADTEVVTADEPSVTPAAAPAAAAPLVAATEPDVAASEPAVAASDIAVATSEAGAAAESTPGSDEETMPVPVAAAAPSVDAGDEA